MYAFMLAISLGACLRGIVLVSVRHSHYLRYGIVSMDCAFTFRNQLDLNCPAPVNTDSSKRSCREPMKEEGLAHDGFRQCAAPLLGPPSSVASGGFRPSPEDLPTWAHDGSRQWAPSSAPVTDANERGKRTPLKEEMFAHDGFAQCVASLLASHTYTSQGGFRSWPEAFFRRHMMFFVSVPRFLVRRFPP